MKNEIPRHTDTNKNKDRMVLIGLVGRKQSGKDTFADYLVSQYGFTKQAFAGPVKEVCRAMFLLTPEQLEDPQQKETVDGRWGLTPRQMMQKVGTDMVRRVWDEDFWLKNMDLRLCGGDVVVSDVRFPNEAQYIRDRGGVLVRIAHNGGALEDPHTSETSQESIREDVCVVNEKNGLTAFYETIENTLPSLFEK